MKLVCHIGHHKTGTTSLQVFLSQNSFALMKAGILYPWVESQGAAIAMTKGLIGDIEGPLPINAREPHNALAFRMLADAIPHWKVPSYHKELPHSNQMLIALRNQAEALQPDTIVLCSEVMSHFGIAAPDQIDRLRKVFDGAEIHLYCALRRPDEHLTSWHGQQLRFGQTPAPLSDPDHGIKFDNLHFDYRAVLRPWVRTMPRATIQIVPYRETIAVGGSVEHFVANAGIAFPEGLLPAATLNVSFPPALYPLLREANRLLPRRASLALSHELDKLTKGLTLPGSKEVEFFGQIARNRMVEHFRPIHDWLSKTTNRPAFFTDLDDMALCKPLPETEALRQVLDEITPAHIAALSVPEAQAFVRQMREHYGAET